MNPRLAIDVRYAAGPHSGTGPVTWKLIESRVESGSSAPLFLMRRPAEANSDAISTLLRGLDRR